MLRNGRNIRIYIRNKDRYNIESKKREFLFVEVADFAGTTIGELKENVQRQCRNALKIEALYLNNQPLANDRSVAHYNLEDETILETTSNPFWVSCLYIKAAEVTQLQQGQPDDGDIQRWTQKSLPKKYTLIGLLLNSKNEYRGQPPHFPTLDDFVVYLEHLNKKAATMHPDYTQKDMRAFEREYNAEFVGRYDDPLSAFLDHYAVKLGYLDPDDIDAGQRPVQRPLPAPARGNVGQAGQHRPPGRKKEQRLCDDCEAAVAEVYCTDCPGGLVLCQPCSAVLHAGATRRRHTLQDIAQAPKVTKAYVPRAFLAPFAIVVGMYSAMVNGRLSLTEAEIKKNAQSLTDTDLQDKQQGKYVGGFDCMENVLMMKGFVQKEASRTPTYALTESGQILGEKLYKFYTNFYKFSEACKLPKVTTTFRDSVIGNRQLCLLIDENERDKERLLRFAAEKRISAQVRLLPAGDYVWILTPAMIDPHLVYTGRDYANEQVLPFVVERKSWEDLGNSAHTARFQRQVNNMMGSGVRNCFYLVEGSAGGTRFSSTHQQQDLLKSLLEKLTTEHGFYVNYTSSWMKSAQWLLWFSGLIMEGLRSGQYHDMRISYTEYMSRVARQQGAAVSWATFRDAHKLTHRWNAQLFVDHIFRDSLQERSMLTSVEEDLRVEDRNKHMLVIENLQQYNKRRQSVLNKCCDAVHANPGQATEIIEDKIGAVVHNMVHYDIASYWQLYIQVIIGVYVVRTETDQERERIQARFLTGPQDPPPPTLNNRNQKTPGQPRRPRKKPAKTVTATTVVADHVNLLAPTTPGRNLRPEAATTQLNRLFPGSETHLGPENRTPGREPQTTPGNRDQFRRRAVINTIDSLNKPSTSSMVQNQTDLNNRRGDQLGRGGLNSTKPTNDHGQFRRKAQIHSMDSLNGGLDGEHVRSRGGMIPGDISDSDTVHAEDRFIKGQSIHPFSGRGFCLGSSTDSDAKAYRDRIAAEMFGNRGRESTVVHGERGRDSNEPHGFQDRSLVKSHGDRDRGTHVGLLGGTRDRAGATNTVDRLGGAEPRRTGAGQGEGFETVDAVPLEAGDFIDSQNEDDILKEILNKSAVEAQPPSNEDAMMRLALELSRRDTTVRTPHRDKDVCTPHTDTEDEQLRRAIQQSQQSEHKPQIATEDELLRKAIEQSRTEVGVRRGQTKSFTSAATKLADTEEEQLKKAIEQSQQEQNVHESHSARGAVVERSGGSGRRENIHCPVTVKLEKNDDQEELVNDIDSEDDMVQRAIEISKGMTPVKKEADIMQDIGSLPEEEQLKLALEMSVNEANTPSKDSCTTTDRKSNNSELNKANTHACVRTPGDKTRAVKRKLGKDIAESSSRDVSAIVDRETNDELSEDEELRKAVLLSKKGAVDDVEPEDDALKEALERSLVEHSPRKKSRKCYKDDLRQALARSRVDSTGDTRFDTRKDGNRRNSDETLSKERGSDEMLGEEQSDTDKSVEPATDRSLIGHSPCNDVGDSKSPPARSGSDLDEEGFESPKSDMGLVGNDHVPAKSDMNLRENDLANPKIDMNLDKNDIANPKKDINFGENNVSTPKSDMELGDNAIPPPHCESDSDEDDIVPPSPEKLSQSLTSSGSRKTRVSFTGAKNKLVSSQSSDGTHGNGNDDVTERRTRSKRKRFDIKSSLFATSDKSESDSVYESDEDIFVNSDVNEESADICNDRATTPKGETSTTVSNDASEKHDANGCAVQDDSEMEEEEHISDSLRRRSDTRTGKEEVPDVLVTGEDGGKEEQAFNELDHLDYYDDDDNDIDFQPGTQEIMEAEQDSEDSDISEEAVNLDDDDDDDDVLPVIQAPRSKRYKELKSKEKQLLQEKLSNTTSACSDRSIISGDDASVRTGRGYCNDDQTERGKRNGDRTERGKGDRDKVYDADRELARVLQEDMDKERRDIEAKGKLVETDEEVAKRLQAELDKVNATGVHSDTDVVELPDIIDLDDEDDESQTVNDAEYARRLQEELNNGPNNSAVPTTNLGSSGKQKSFVHAPRGVARAGDIAGGGEGGGLGVRGGGGIAGGGDLGGGTCIAGGQSADLVRELQRRELEKIERLKRSLQKDEDYAKQLLHSRGTETTDMQKKEDVSSPEVGFKRQVAQQKIGKEQTQAQLNDYRRLQMERFRGVGPGYSVPSQNSDARATATTIDLTQPSHRPPTDWEDQRFTQQATQDPFSHRAPTIQSQSTIGSHMTQPIQSQNSIGSHMTQPSQSQSKPSASGHMTQPGQSQQSNITCGNCGGKGHTRKFVHCPRYHTAEETSRRDEKAREDRRKKELKAMQEKIKVQINAQKDERKKKEIQNMQAVVMTAETEFQTTMNQLRNIIQHVENLAGSDNNEAGNTTMKHAGKKRKK